MVRDLAWACFSPSLLDAQQLDSELYNCQPALTPRRLQFLKQLDDKPLPLIQFIEQRPSRRLGLYFERLWHFFLQQDPDIELLAHNLPVREAGITIGEFDCLYRCLATRQCFHLELAVKFYLWSGQCWLGTNVKDQLDRKVDRMVEHQSALASHRGAAPLLEQLNIGSLTKQVEVKGILFAPAGAGDNFLAWPAALSSAADSQAIWLPLNQLDDHLSDTTLRFQPLDRMQWLSSSVEGPQLNYTQLQQYLDRHFTNSERALQIVIYQPSAASPRRAFITSNDWPQQ
jgi:uncharacterized protein